MDFPAYCAVAFAGIGVLPDTISSRSIIIEMKRRAPDERVEPFRERIHRKQAGPIYGGLMAWARFISKKIEGQYPELPNGVTDRDADCWEPLLAIADAAGGDWPQACQDAAVYLVRRGQKRAVTTGVELLRHIYEAFGEEDRLWTIKLLKLLHDRDESPWADIRGKPLTDRGLADRLKKYGITSKQVRIAETNKQGYLAADFHDTWTRYLFPVDPTDPTSPTNLNNKNNFVGDVGDVGPTAGRNGGTCTACDGFGCPTCRPEDHGMKPRPAGGYGKGGMQ